MNRRMILYVIGFILAAEGALLLLPAIVSLIYLESAIWSFLITAAVCGALGAVMTGSGSGVYALFGDADTARTAVEALRAMGVRGEQTKTAPRLG